NGTVFLRRRRQTPRGLRRPQALKLVVCRGRKLANRRACRTLRNYISDFRSASSVRCATRFEAPIIDARNPSKTPTATMADDAYNPGVAVINSTAANKSAIFVFTDIFSSGCRN